MKRSSLRVGFHMLKVWQDCISPETAFPFNVSISLSPAPSPPPTRGSRPVAPTPYTVLRLAPGGLRSGRPPLQSRMKLEERGLQRGDFSLWLRPARSADAGEYSAAVNLKNRALTCRLRLRVGQAQGRWGRGGGRQAGKRAPSSTPSGGRKGWAQAVLLRMRPKP